MWRNVIGAVIALLGATAAVLSPFQNWYDGRPGRDVRLQELFTAEGLTSARADLLAGMFLVMALAALLAVVGIALRSRAGVALAGVLVLAFTALWTVRQYQVADSLLIGAGGVGGGAAAALGGGVLMLIGALVMSGRQPALHAVRVPEEQHGEDIVEGPWPSTGGAGDPGGSPPGGHRDAA